jgi:hypothetical protein
VVFDTTVVVSALLFTSGRVAWLRAHWRAGDALPLASRAIIEELIRSGSLPLFEQVLIDLVGPPIGAGLFWLLSRGWAITVQGGSVSDRTRARQVRGFWVVMAVSYVVMIAITVYGYFS